MQVMGINPITKSAVSTRCQAGTAMNSPAHIPFWEGHAKIAVDVQGGNGA